MSNPVFRFATVQGQNIHWFLKRNCSVTPVQLGWFYASLCAVSLGIATFFWFQGAVLILPFAWAELAAVGSEVAVLAEGGRARLRRRRTWISGWMGHGSSSTMSRKDSGAAKSTNCRSPVPST